MEENGTLLRDSTITLHPSTESVIAIGLDEKAHVVHLDGEAHDTESCAADAREAVTDGREESLVPE